MHPTQSRNITSEVTHHTIAMALRYPYHGPRRLSKLLRRDRICLTASSVNIILRQKNLRSRLKRIERAKNWRKKTHWLVRAKRNSPGKSN